MTEKNKEAESIETSRRSFLKTAGKISVYTTPAMLLMSKPSFATFNKTGGGGHGYYPVKRHFNFFRLFFKRHGHGRRH